MMRTTWLVVPDSRNCTVCERLPNGMQGSVPPPSGLSPIRTELELCGHSGCTLRVARDSDRVGCHKMTSCC